MKIQIIKIIQYLQLNSVNRWILTSGHDSTVSANLVLLIKALGLDMATKFHFPKYASQLALEVRTYSEKCKDYSDYYIVGFFDNTELFNISVNEFIDKIEKEIWTDQQVDEYCGFYNGDKTKNIYKILMIVFICLFVVLLVTTIILGYKLYKSIHSKDLKQKINDIDDIDTLEVKQS